MGNKCHGQRLLDFMFLEKPYRHQRAVCVQKQTKPKEPAATGNSGTRIMTQQEFTQRVNVEVSNKEFEAINEVYMNSDLDKDEFCKMWVKMNKTRVQNAKVERMIKAKDEAYRDALHKFYTKNDDVNEFMTPICYVKISTYEVQAMSYAGIKVANEDGRAKYLSDIRYEIGKFLRMY